MATPNMGRIAGFGSDGLRKSPRSSDNSMAQAQRDMWRTSSCQ
jgi:hypothetical protein